MKRYDICEKHGVEGHGCSECESEEKLAIKNSMLLGDLVKFLENYIPCFVEQYKSKRYYHILDGDDIEILAFRIMKWFEERSRK